jgi:antibiotic biosynthesis monooxygenase (ABM) superfamily enzyme
LTVFAGNVTSVALLTWVVVPTASRAFRRWLDPIDGAGPRISGAGAAVVVLGSAALILIFAFVG